ncbi:MAG: hypothetical protein RL761_1380 [Pseudomonadota bacterium]|jgi:hypothetical protein
MKRRAIMLLVLLALIIFAFKAGLLSSLIPS